MSKDMRGEYWKEARDTYLPMGFKLFLTSQHDKKPFFGSHGFLDATNNSEELMQMLNAHPYCMLAVATGNGLLVVDIDIKDGVDGFDTLHRWEKEHGALPETASVITASGGMHLYYHTDSYIHNNQGVRDASGMLTGIDIRCDGGYVIAPPSINEYGQQYCWQDYPDEVGIADADENVIAFIKKYADAQIGKSCSRSDGKGLFQLPSTKYVQGERNGGIFKLTCSLKSRNVPADIVTECIQVVNQRHCVPPLPENELMRTIESALSYENTEAEKRAYIKSKRMEEFLAYE